MKRLRSHSIHRRRGAVLVFVGVTLITLLLCASLAVDVGYICALTAEAQNTADAGALAGAVMLQQGKSDELMKYVYEVIGMNQKRQGFLSLDDQIIEVGRWDSQYQKFSALPPDEWEDGAFAVRVRAVRNNAQLFFAAIAGHTETDVWREAVAVGSRGCRGIWGLEGIRIGGNVVTDSYNSDDGPYASLTAEENGDLCSGRAIRISGSPDINGDAMAGYGYPIDINGTPLITGTTTSNLEDVQPPTLDYDDIAFNNDNSIMPLTVGGNSPYKNGNELVIGSNDTLIVPPGNYYLSGIKINSTSLVTITGPTLFYVTGTIDTAGQGLVNSTADPGNLTIVSVGSEISMSGGSAFYGTIIAPDADLNFTGGAVIYGAIIARTITVGGNFEIHVDESLAALDLMAPPATFLVK